MLTPGEIIWEDLTFSPLTDLQDLMSQVKMFTQLEDDVHQAKQNASVTPGEKGNSKGKRKAQLITRAGQGRGSMWFLRNQSTSSFIKSEINRTLRGPTHWEGTLKGTINGACVPIMRRKDT